MPNLQSGTRRLSLPSLLRWRWAAPLLLAGSVIAGCGTLDTQQRKWIFMPAPALAALEAQAAARADGLEDVWIEHRSRASGSTVTLHGLWMAHENPRAPVVLYLHGSRRNVETNLFRMQQIREYGFSVLGVDYRGFGLSTNELPSETGAYEDATAAWRWLAQHHPERPRFIYGHSLGGAIAIDLASRMHDAAGLIVEGTFTSIPAVFETLRWGWLPISALITQRFDSLDKIADVRAPVLVVHGTADRLILPSLGRTLFEHASAPKRFVLVEGGTHHSAGMRGSQQVRAAMQELFSLQS